MTAIVPGYNATGLWLPASGSPTKWFSGQAAGSSVTGTSGNDSFSAPGGGATIYGGLGDDTYSIWNARNFIVELPGQGTDTLVSYVVTYLLPDNVENMVVEASGASGTGNALDNILAGGSGTQILDGGAGNDILTGGAGADRFVMQGGTGRDLITDFEIGTDKLVIGSAFAFNSFSDIQATLTQVGTDAVLALSANDSVTFRGRSAAAFTAADFILPEASLMGSLHLTFSDEFTSFTGTPSGLTASGAATWKTTYMWGDRTLPANKEAEYYTDSTVGPNPFSLQTGGTGALDITATPTTGLPNGLTYSSGVIISENSEVQTYGFFEMRAKIPSGTGFWPAFWLLRADGAWPPELDAMEVLGDAPGRLYTTAHSQASGTHTQVSGGYATVDLSLDYHTYAVSWRPDMIRWYLDGTEVYAAATPADMHSPMYMIANLAVGGQGSWAGPADGVSSATMSIDYIKSYQFNDLTDPVRPDLVSGKLISGNSWAENITGSAGGDRIEAKGGNDTITGGGGADVFAFSAADGTDTITDFVSGTDKLLFYGVSSVTTAKVAAGLTVTAGPSGTVLLKSVSALAAGDIIYGDAPLFGTSGGDQLDRSGSGNAQFIAGQGGNDTILGGSGDDCIGGAGGDDVLTGGPGRDTFVFDNWNWHDRITDFQSGIDRIMLRSIAHDTVWVNPSRDAAGVAGLEVDYATGQSIFLPGLTSLADGDLVFA